MDWKDRPFVRKGLLAFSVICFSPLVSQVFLGSLNFYNNLRSQKIEDPLEMRLVLEEELCKQHVPPQKKVDFIWDIYTKGKSGIVKSGTNQYIIIFRKGSNTSAVAQHEIYHLTDGHCDKKSYGALINKFRYWLINEPQATLYTTTGIRL
jgi:hypothetical protein